MSLKIFFVSSRSTSFFGLGGLVLVAPSIWMLGGFVVPPSVAVTRVAFLPLRRGCILFCSSFVLVRAKFSSVVVAR